MQEPVVKYAEAVILIGVWLQVTRWNFGDIILAWASSLAAITGILYIPCRRFESCLAHKDALLWLLR